MVGQPPQQQPRTSPPRCHLARSYISLDGTFSLSFGASVKSQDILNAQTDLAGRMLQSVSTNYVDQVTTFREIVLSDSNLPGFSDMLTTGNIEFVLSRCNPAFAGYSSIRVGQVGTCCMAAVSRKPHLAFRLRKRPVRSHLVTKRCSPMP